MARRPRFWRLAGKLPALPLGSPVLSSPYGTLGVNATLQAAALVSSLLVARRLGEDVRGQYAGAVAWCALLSAMADFGVSQAMAYRAARSDGTPGATIGTGIAFALATGIAGALVGLVAITLILAPAHPETARATAIYLPSIPILLVSTYCARAAQGLGRIATFNTMQLAHNITTLAGVVLAIGLGARLGVTVMGSIVSLQAVALLFTLLMLHRQTTARSWRIDREEWRHLRRYGLHAHLGNLAWLANGKLDQLVMSVALSERQLGHYAIATSYAGIVFALTNAMTDSRFAALAAEMSSTERLRSMTRAMKRSFVLAGGLVLILAVAAPWIIPFVFSEKYRESVVPALILLPGAVVLGLNYTLSVGLRVSGHPILTSAGEGVGLLFTAVGLPLALARGGIIGASILSVASYGATFLALGLLLRRVVHGPIKGEPSLGANA